MRQIIAGLLLAAVPACAFAIDAKALARFDVGYARCEAIDPQMQGRRDAAYLGVWKIRSTAKVRDDLAALRKGAAYQAEYKRADARLTQKKSPETDRKLAQQCAATKGQTLAEPAAPAASK